MEEDLLMKKAAADAIIERAARQLKEVLHELAVQFVPFPTFPGSDIPAVEAEPGALASRDRGCVVVCPDGELYELQVSTDFSSGAPLRSLGIQPPFDLASAFQPEIRRLDLSPRDYIAYAYNAICVLIDLMDERQRQSETDHP